MKIRKGFVTNSSSTSFIITNKTDKDLTLLDFVKENSHLLEKFPLIATIEEHALIGGFGSIFNSFAVKKSPLSVQIINYGIPDKFVYHGESDKLIKEMGLDSESIAQDLFLKSKKILSHMGAL